MSRPRPSMRRQFLGSRPWTRRPAQRLGLAVVCLLIALRSRVTSKDLPRYESEMSQALGTMNKTLSNGTRNWIPMSTSASNNDGGFHVAYGGYLRSGSSMLALRTNDDNGFGVGRNDFSKEQSRRLNERRRSKRGVKHLYNMIVCATGCDPLSYKGYGCYCGFLGSGYPMDGIDRCCKMHDWCYDATDCPMFVEYFIPYYWKCYRGYSASRPVCAIEHGEWGSPGSCAQRLCECDRLFAECLRRYRCPRHKAVCTSSPLRLIQNIFMII